MNNQEKSLKVFYKFYKVFVLYDSSQFLDEDCGLNENLTDLFLKSFVLKLDENYSLYNPNRVAPLIEIVEHTINSKIEFIFNTNCRCQLKFFDVRSFLDFKLNSFNRLYFI